LPALYADFESQRFLNPDGYRANVDAWRQAITRAALEGRLAAIGSSALVVDVSKQLLASLEHRRYGQPLAFDAVLRDSAFDKRLIPLDAFLSGSRSIYQTSQATLPWIIAAWIARTLGFSDSWLLGHAGTTGTVLGQFVVVDNLAILANRVREDLSGAASQFELTFTRQHFFKMVADMQGSASRPLSGVDVDVLLTFMSRDLGVARYDGKVVKFDPIGATATVRDNRANHITEEDATIASLRELIENLRDQTAMITQRIDTLSLSAKAQVARSDTISAKAALRSRKLLQDVLQKQLATLGQLEQVATSIEQASDQAHFVGVLESSSGLLERLNTEVGGVERVEKAMEGLQAHMLDVEAIQETMAGASPSSEEEDAVAAELEKLAQEEDSVSQAVENREDTNVADVDELARRLADLEHSLPSVPGPSGQVTAKTVADDRQPSRPSESDRGAARQVPAE